MPADEITADVAKEYLRTIDPTWRSFWFHMHLIARNLTEFADGLSVIDDDTFTYHVSGQKNDLMRWVREVVGDTVLSRQLLSIASARQAADIVQARVKQLKDVLGEPYQPPPFRASAAALPDQLRKV